MKINEIRVITSPKEFEEKLKEIEKLDELLKIGSTGNFQKESFEKELKEISKRIRKLLVKKNENYGQDNLVEDGAKGIAIRMKDKLNRISGTKDTKIAFKEFEDIAGYALMALYLLQNGRITIERN